MSDCIHGPVEGHAGVTDVASYRQVHAAAMHLMKKTVQENSDPVVATINHGRWVVSCTCNGAGLTSPAMGCSCCFDCGTAYTAITFPKHLDQIVAVLLTRPDITTRNWAGETVAELAAQNKTNLD